MKLIFSLILFLISFSSYADELTAYSLYESRFMLPKVLLPFHVSGTIDSDEIKAEIDSVNHDNCQIMQDPFIKSNFLLKCLKPDEIGILFSVKRENVIYKIQIPAVKVIEQNNVIIPEAEEVDLGKVQRENGKTLYRSLCISCHSTMSIGILSGRSAAQIASAYGAKGMPVFDYLKSSDLKALETFFKNISESEKKGLK